jgi:hypothetical protein
MTCKSLWNAYLYSVIYSVYTYVCTPGESMVVCVVTAASCALPVRGESSGIAAAVVSAVCLSLRLQLLTPCH